MGTREGGGGQQVRFPKDLFTFGLAVPEGDGAFVLGRQSSSAGEAEDPAGLGLVRARRAQPAGAEAVGREVACGTLAWRRRNRKGLQFASMATRGRQRSALETE